MPTRFWIALSSSCIWRRSLRSSAPERLVEQQHRPARRQAPGPAPRAGAGRRKARAASCRRCLRARPAPARPLRLRLALGPADATHLQTEADIAGDAHMRKQRIVLEHRRRRTLRRRTAVTSLPRDADTALARREETADHRQQRRLAADPRAQAARRSRLARCSDTSSSAVTCAIGLRDVARSRAGGGHVSSAFRNSSSSTSIISRMETGR